MCDLTCYKYFMAVARAGTRLQAMANMNWLSEGGR